MSVGSMAARVGGMLSPLVLELQQTIPWFTQVKHTVLRLKECENNLSQKATSRISQMVEDIKICKEKIVHNAYIVARF